MTFFLSRICLDGHGVRAAAGKWSWSLAVVGRGWTCPAHVVRLSPKNNRDFVAKCLRRELREAASMTVFDRMLNEGVMCGIITVVIYRVMMKIRRTGVSL